VINPGSKLTVAGVIESTSGGIKFPDGSVQITSGGGAGVSSLNGLKGSVTLAAGSNISITPSGTTLTIAATVQPAVSLSCTTVTQNYNGSVDLSCASGYTAVLASCTPQGNIVINGQSPPPPTGSWANYLTPSVTAATGLHCNNGGAGTSQAQLRCCRTQ
jgi:hypothetical protein